MQDLLSDLVAEQQALDQYLQTLREKDWSRATPAEGWDVRDSISHLAHIEECAFDVLEGDGSRVAELKDHPSFDAFTQAGVERGRKILPNRVLEWWREARAHTVEALSRATGRERVLWVSGEISSRTLATLRLMETWAHGLDVHQATGTESEDSERLRHVAWLGWKSLPFAFSLAGEDYEQPVRVEVFGPNYRKWVFGPEDTDQVIRGPAAEWCRVVVRRLPVSRAEHLTAHGEVAQAALRIARVF
jgi:uncharacterized protein (TIGR03084 family)